MSKRIDEQMLLRAEPILAKDKTIDDLKDIKIELNLLDKDKKTLNDKPLEKAIPKAEETKNIKNILEKYNSTFKGRYIIKYETSAKEVAKDLGILETDERYKQISYLSFRIDANCNGKFDKSEAEKWFDVEICQCGILEEDFNQIFPKAPAEKRKEVLEIFNKYFCVFEINTPLRVSHFFAQVRAEVGENIDYKFERVIYSAKRLKSKIPLKDEDGNNKSAGPFKYFHENPAEADKYGSIKAIGQRANEEAIANRAYAHRIGNGDIKSGDGWNFRGKGFIQLTGRTNYENVKMELQSKVPNENIGDIVENPNLAVASIKNAMLTSMAYWTMNNLNKKSDNTKWDREKVDNITDVVNFGTPTREERKKHFDFIKSILNK